MISILYCGYGVSGIVLTTLVLHVWWAELLPPSSIFISPVIPKRFQIVLMLGCKFKKCIFVLLFWGEATVMEFIAYCSLRNFFFWCFQVILLHESEYLFPINITLLCYFWIFLCISPEKINGNVCKLCQYCVNSFWSGILIIESTRKRSGRCGCLYVQSKQ